MEVKDLMQKIKHKVGHEHLPKAYLIPQWRKICKKKKEDKKTIS